MLGLLLPGLHIAARLHLLTQRFSSYLATLRTLLTFPQERGIWRLASKLPPLELVRAPPPISLLSLGDIKGKGRNPPCTDYGRI